MTTANNFIVLNIREYLGGEDNRLGEDHLKQLLSEFSCPLNPDAELLGYFSITIKPLVINAEPFSNTTKRKLSRFSEIDKDEQTFHIAAYLIAQLGKNFKNNANKKISGNQLLETAIKQTQLLQYQAGGMVTFVETDNKKELLSFYKNYGFKRFDIRQSTSKDRESHELVQLLKLI